MNHAEWLAKNSIDCKPLGARISKEQCAANQGHTFACETCLIGGVKYAGPPKVSKKARDKTAPVIQKQPSPAPIIADKKELKMSVKGTCITCKRPDLSLPKGNACGRCGYRISMGRDPLTNEPIAIKTGLAVLADNESETGVQAKKTGHKAATPSVAATPPILPEKRAQTPPAFGTCTIDVIQVLDDAWHAQRVDIVRRLNDSKGDCSRLALTISVVERIKQLGA